MVAIVEQTLGHIHGRNIGTLVLQAIEYELMLTQPSDGKLIYIL